ncbi:hypothetical protein PITCH_A720035 [uncultured Desulfobacterium sp.]|uniref:Uncharacterized protein n=1 Tax=uncultured Desulfobacterium sp. TaxID=201089 RepID=A0A445N1W7_9BACT|nr:hypothetical protein PITCH_A720035 [uncultured Desulfobacterium sp.]
MSTEDVLIFSVLLITPILNIVALLRSPTSGSREGWMSLLFKRQVIEVMKERLLDIIKWGLILVIAGAILFFVFPKYDFEAISYGSGGLFKCNKFTGEIKKVYPKK